MAFATAILAVVPVRADVLELDGAGDYVTFPATGIPSGSASFTIECWINPASIPAGGENGGQMTFWGNETGNQANGFRLRGPSGVRHFFWGNDHDENMGISVLPDTTGPNSNGWHHFAITWNGSQTRWYWNGAPLGNPRTASGVNVAAANHRIGARPGGEFFHGYMDEIRVWNVARTATEIATDFQRELNGDEAGLVAYWNFEGDLGDRAGGNNNGSPVGNAIVTAGVNAPVAPVGPRIYSFTATPSSIYLAQSSTLSWAISNATYVFIDQDIGVVSPSNSVVVTPSATTTYTLTATNANGSRVVMTTITVDPGIPTAQNFSTNTAFNTPVAITLRGSDPQGSNLTYSIVTPPAHGSLSGEPPDVTYSPMQDYGGPDSFTFRVNDGAFDSAPATVTIDVIPPATPPSGVVLSTTNIPSSAGPGAFVAALRAIDINTQYGDTHTFALVSGYGQNSQFVINGSSLSTGPSFAGGPGATFSLRIRVTDSTSLSGTQDVTLAVNDVARTVVINEFHYNPSFNPIRESFVELYNDTDNTIDLSNWRVRGGIDFFFPQNTFIAPREFIVLAEDPATIQSRYGVTAFGPWSGGLNNDGEEITLRDALNTVVDRVDFQNEFPWPIAPDGNGPSAQLVHPSLDNDLGSSWRSALPTPGATNSVWATNAAPNIRQVDHSPNSPRSTNQVLVTCKVTDPDGVAAVSLAYQVVLPGSYIPATLPLTTAQLNNLNNAPMTNSLNPAFEHPTNWTTVVMHDDGLNGDAVAGDNIFSVLLPQQAHRTLVRYRITCTDLLGASRRAPFEDDSSLNFAYFVYDGVPNYLGFSAASLQTLPIFTLITRDADLAQCTAWFNTSDQLTTQIINGRKNEGRFHFNWEGAMVYDGEVYDHIHYRLRGANGRYHPGKRSIRYKFNDGRLLRAKDQYGERFPTKWRELTTGKGQSNRGGEQFALNEIVNFFLWNKVGVPAPLTLHFHFRVIRGASETGDDQYSGDFWGLNWAQQKYDVDFLETHNLPKGNLYKLIDNLSQSLDEQRYQGAFAVTNGADLFNVEDNLDGFKSTDWLNAHANYTNWYRYFTIARAIRHYDTWPSANKNGAYYFEPLYGVSNSFLGRMMQLPYDSTDTWGATWNNGDDILYNGIFPSGATGGDAGQNPEMQKEYRNVAREIRALLFQPDQINAIIDAHANPLLPVAAADYQRWRAAPAPASYNSLAIPTSPGVTGGLPAFQQDMKNFMFVGGNNGWWIDRQSVGAGGWVTILDTEANDAAIPARPTISYVGGSGFPLNGLTFQSSAFSDPQGAGTFAAMQWRIAEVLASNVVVTNPSQLRLEWDAAWTSPEFTAFNGTITFPSFAVQDGKRYRARVRHKDDTGRWSAWSLPIEFVPSPADTVSALRTNLVFSEIMYNPPADGAADGDDFEFIELKNIGPFTLDLSGLFFSQGITFTFTNGTTLAPGAVFLLARNPAMLVTRYPGTVVHGDYSDRLNNDGETVTISHPTAGQIISVTYDDRTPWPVAADGAGFSLVLDEATGTYHASAARLGSPGVDDAAYGPGAIVINELLSNSTLPLKDSIELLNIGTTNVDISGWYLTDNPSFPQKFRIPARPPLAPGEFAVFTEDDFNPTPGAGVSFSLSSLGDEVYVFSAAASGESTGYSHGLEFGAAAENETFGRHVNSVGDEQFPAQIARTFGLANVGPRVGPLVINEIHYNPEAGGDEFVEIRNVSASAVSLFDPGTPTNTWRVNGIGFSFPTNVTLGAGELAVVSGIDPAAFRARYNVPAQVAVFGPYGGTLQDSGERLELQQAGAPVSNTVPFITIDEVRYNDRGGWPVAADGHGPSLQRRASAEYGNDPSNWVAAAISPGVELSADAPPVFATHPRSQTSVGGTTVTNSVTFTGTEPIQIRWRFNGTNLPGETNATLILPNIQLSQAGLYSVVLFNSAGSAVSLNGTQTVLAPVTFTIQPTNQNVLSGTNVTLVSAAVGTGTVRYQWRFEGTNILDATNASYSFTGANLANHHGNFSVVAMDDISTTASSNAFVYVLVRPGFLVNPQPQSVLQGGTATFTAVATGAPPIWYRWLRAGSAVVTNSTGVLVLTNVQANANIRVLATNLASGASGVNMNPAGGVLLTMLPDFDRDGMADWWETNYPGLFATNNAADATLDYDDDGMINRDEYVAGTNPTNALSLLKLFVSDPGATAMEFVAQTNVGYTVQWRTNLTAAPWMTLTNVPPQPSQVRTISVSAPNPPPGDERYYRVVTPLVP